MKSWMVDCGGGVTAAEVSRKGRRLFIFFVLFFVSLSGMALEKSEIIDGRVWTYSIEGDGVIVERIGEDKRHREDVLQGDVVIPEEIGGMKVKGIGHWLFNRQRLLKSVVVPSGVQELPWSAFQYCTNLTRVVLPEEMKEIGRGAFDGCSRLTHFSIPNGIRVIPKDAFYGCESLKEINIPPSVEVIDDNAFQSCSSLRVVRMGEGVREIGNSAFSGCVSMESIRLPESVTNIEVFAFNGCRALREITIPPRIERLGRTGFTIFRGCSSLMSVTLPKGLKDLSGRVFSRCCSLQEIEIPDGVTNLPLRVFEDCDLRKVVLGRGIQSIEAVAFCNNWRLKVIEFHGDAPRVGEFAFLGNWMCREIPDDCVFRIYRGAKGWEVLGTDEGKAGLKVKIEDKIFPLEYIDDDRKVEKRFSLPSEEELECDYGATNSVADLVYRVYPLTKELERCGGEFPSQEVRRVYYHLMTNILERMEVVYDGRSAVILMGAEHRSNLFGMLVSFPIMREDVGAYLRCVDVVANLKEMPMDDYLKEKELSRLEDLKLVEKGLWKATPKQMYGPNREQFERKWTPVQVYNQRVQNCRRLLVPYLARAFEAFRGLEAADYQALSFEIIERLRPSEDEARQFFE